MPCRRRWTRCWPRRKWPATATSRPTNWRVCRPPRSGEPGTTSTRSPPGQPNWPRPCDCRWPTRWPGTRRVCSARTARRAGRLDGLPGDRRPGRRGLFAAALAAQLAQECGGLCTPATRSPVSPTPLTGRQREVAELVVAGLSNKEIADRLVTSVRTVEGHLYRACQRVGASSRSDLAAIMRAGPGS
ncbi:helix-turn-helix transcriptional regulator [Mycolicibacterium chitae]|uniref:helix-turn-helix transcriptional regulator n=1 Tax=Mycolicibacterium chitae TaxID=1792 RepID=UPI001476BB3D|nr:helix-turn-helix transcriptional regulator [Mycolicibacterium chitae]